MKTAITLMSVLCLATLGFAGDSPIDKGRAVIGGELYFQSQSDSLYDDWEGNSLNTLSLTSQVSVFAAQGVALGAEVELLSMSQGDDEITLFTLGPRIAYYFPVSKDRFEAKGSVYPFVAGLAGFGSISDGDQSISLTKFGGEAGLLIMVSNSVGADFAFRITRDRQARDEWDQSGTTIKVGVGISAFL